MNEEYSNIVDDLRHRLHSLNRKFERENAISKVLLGKLLLKMNQGNIQHLHDAEFRVYSQFGDDGIIQYLVGELDIKEKIFIEFGVENYNESNTRFLLENNNWRGLVLDGSDANVEYIRKTSNYWRHDLTALSRFVTAENINDILSDAGFTGDVGLLHIDIDGNDYWVWSAIESINPAIVIVEYNSLFGSERRITVPYKPSFSRLDEHYSGLYAGASLAALVLLAQKKGYKLVGCNSAGNNAYFVRADCKLVLPATDVSEAYVLAKFREHRDNSGQLTFTPGIEAIKCIQGMPVFNVETNRIEPF